MGLDFDCGTEGIVLIVRSYRLALSEGQSLGVVHLSVGSNNSVLISPCLVVLKGLCDELVH